MVCPIGKTFLTRESCCAIKESLYVEYVRKCEQNIASVLKHGIIPTPWILSYVSFFRIAGQPMNMASNFHLAGYYYKYKKPRSQQKSPVRPKNIRGLFFSARVNLVESMAPFTIDAEQGFCAKMEALGIAAIKPDDAVLRQTLFDLDFISSTRHQTYPTHLWASTIHLTHDQTRPIEDGMPCIRCDIVTKAMYGYNVAGFKTVIWREEYAPANCAEPLALALAIHNDPYSGFDDHGEGSE